MHTYKNTCALLIYNVVLRYISSLIFIGNKIWGYIRFDRKDEPYLLVIHKTITQKYISLQHLRNILLLFFFFVWRCF